jgi:hypothetical protein
MSVSIFRVNEIKSNYYYPRANGAKPGVSVLLIPLKNFVDRGCNHLKYKKIFDAFRAKALHPEVI